MKSYIDLKTGNKIKIINDFNKLSKNSVFGNTIELSDEVDVRLVKTEAELNNIIRKLNLETSYNIVLWKIDNMSYEKTKLKLDLTVYVGMSVLDISKTSM